MKAYERAARTILPAGSWTVIRLDGRAFHTWTRDLDRPFSVALIEALADGMEALCRELAGVAVAYCQSDEISVVLTDFAHPNTQAFLDGQVQKLVSISASVLTARFARHFPERPPAVFDARAFTLPDRDEARNYLLWRQQDARRNAIGMLAAARFTPEQLHGVGTPERRAMLHAAGIDVDQADPRFLHGQTCHRVRRTVIAERWAWLTAPAPTLDCQPGTFLDRVLPPDLSR
jgi:tRNA(His) 5'-end guanylyltransferase